MRNMFKNKVTKKIRKFEPASLETLLKLPIKYRRSRTSKILLNVVEYWNLLFVGPY